MSFFKRFFEWQNYIHYALLTSGLFAWRGLQKAAELESARDWLGMFWWYTLGFIIIDSLIHGLFWILPKPLQWRD